MGILKSFCVTNSSILTAKKSFLISVICNLLLSRESVMSNYQKKVNTFFSKISTVPRYSE